MEINEINSDIQRLNTISFLPQQNQKSRTNSLFDEVYKAAVEVIDETNRYVKQSEEAQLEFITGQSDDMIKVTMAQAKAQASFSFTLQVTNKVIESYREIMRMQI